MVALAARIVEAAAAADLFPTRVPVVAAAAAAAVVVAVVVPAAVVSFVKGNFQQDQDHPTQTYIPTNNPEMNLPPLLRVVVAMEQLWQIPMTSCYPSLAQCFPKHRT